MSLKKQFLYIMAAGLLASCGRMVTVKQIDIIPEPVFMLQKEGGYTLNRSVSIAVSGLGQNSPTAKYIMNSLRHSHLRPSLVSLSEEHDMELALNDTLNPELGDEGYLLEVRQTGIRLSANTEVGLLYAYQTFRQIIPYDVLEHTYSAITLPECTILDYPRFAWRGLFIDTSRKHIPVKEFRKLLDLMASYKMNRLCWQLPDSTALLIPRGPDDSVDLEMPELYTEEDIAEVAAYAYALGITVVREGDTTLARYGDKLVMERGPLQSAHAAARAGKKVIISPDEYCRFDCYQADPRYQPMATDGLITLAKAYEFDPAPQGTNKYVEQSILGGQCSLWPEYIDNAAQAEYMLLPRLLAVSERLWAPQENKSWSRFRKKVELQKARLEAKGYNYCEGSFTPLFRASRVDDKTMNIAIETEVPSTYIFYTLDGSTPTRNSQVYLGPINLQRGTHIKIQPVYKDKERDSVYEFVIR